MCLLVDSIKIQDRVPQNLNYHNARLNNSRHELFGKSDRIDLRNVLHIPIDLTDDVYKCRVIYKEAILSQEYLRYTPRIIKTLRLVADDDIDYTHKYLERSQLDKLRESSGTDDILIVKNNFITDASSANVVFFDGRSWLTPSKPLLKGTKRQQLLDKRIIHEEDISMNNLKRFQKCVLINAMLDLEEENFIPMDHIFGI
jgi:4-amino-4-deoxychorismate lyase